MIDDALSFHPEEVHMDGASHLMAQPEFRDPQTMGQLVRLVEEKAPLAQALGRQWRAPGLNVSIGREFSDTVLRGFSVVQVPYRHRGRVVGALGVLGPTRMAYDHVTGVLRHLASRLEETLAREGA